TVTARPNIAAALARHRTALLERDATAPAPPPVGVADAAVILRRLDVDANERERLDVLAAAARAENDDPREADHYLIGLVMRVDEVSAAVARRRLAAQWLAALEEPVVAAVRPPDDFLGTAARLRHVVAGDEDLTPQLRTEAAEAVARAADIARQ